MNRKKTKGEEVEDSTTENTKSPKTSEKSEALAWKDILGPKSKGVVKRVAKKKGEAADAISQTALSSKYAPPSQYAHLSPLVDVLEPGLILAFVGVNPGIATATAGHAYAHPSNRFWYLLHNSGLTPERQLSPTEDRTLPYLYQMGWTNIVSRATKDQSQLSKEEMVEGAGILEEKFRKWRPEAVCLVGKGIWEAVFKYKHGRAIKKGEFNYGWQKQSENMGRVTERTAEEGEEPWPGAWVFVATSTSGLAAGLSLTEKEDIWRPLGQWVEKRRREKKGSAGT